MNVNIKVSLTDEQRNRIKCNLAGKELKALVTRKEIVEQVESYIQSLLEKPLETPELAELAQKVLDFDADLPDDAHPECCKQNILLLRRVNLLQFRLDTGRK